MNGRPRDAGLTLVEVLVVLAIGAAMAGATVLGLGSLGRGASGEAEALRLADRLRLAADEAMVTSVPLALVWDPRGYRFLAWDPAQAAWRDSGHGDLGRRHRLPSGLRLGREDGGEGPALIAPDLPLPPSLFSIAGASGTWRVGFEGFGAAVADGN
jgi:general secretion pathway protein H